VHYPHKGNANALEGCNAFKTGGDYFISYIYPNNNIYINALHFVEMQYLKEGFNLFYLIYNTNALPL
jgi:hypothetical protein